MINNPLINHIEILRNFCWQASKEKKPALWLYQQQGRTQFFMLEALCRLFYKGLEMEGFKTRYNLFKKYEDLMGAINCYDEILESFKGNKAIPVDVLNFWVNARQENIDKLEKEFEKDSYLIPQLLKFKEMIEADQIHFDKKTISLIGKAIKKELKKITNDFSAINFEFTDIENHIHELRRKTRWLGIYSQALNGIIVLKEDKTNFEWEENYITEAVVNSPFHQLIKNQTFEKYIILNKKHFMAFTWLIAQLGELKEVGLRFEMLVLAIVKTEDVAKEEAILKANDIIKSEVSIETILLKASNMAKEFFEINKIPKGLFSNKM